MDEEQLATILNRIHQGDVGGVTKEELEYCENHALSTWFTTDGRSRVALLQKGKQLLKDLQGGSL